MIFFILLLLAGILRWEKGPIQNQGDFQVAHIKDYWTGQSWVLLFGGFEDFQNETNSEPYPLYSGEWIPHLRSEELREQMELILASEENQAQWRKLEENIKELEEVKSSTREGHDLYLELIEKNNFKNKTSSTEELSAAHQAWNKADQAIYEYTLELNSFYTNLKTEMLQNYKIEAKKRERIASLIWLGLLIIFFIFALHYFVMEIKRWKRVNETYEIVEYVTKNNRFTQGK
ncbi:MAG TPA: hypothetical protein DDZ91_14650 [Firmicutes bacterium]|jgi:hypothetical protein|nr:hypothetical protein [Bacillota bacterium]